MARSIHEVLDSDRELYNEYRRLSDNPERLDEMAAIMEGCGYAAEYNLMRRSTLLTRKMLEFERTMK
jgi:hypothetical protein